MKNRTIGRRFILLGVLNYVAALFYIMDKHLKNSIFFFLPKLFCSENDDKKGVFVKKRKTHKYAKKNFVRSINEKIYFKEKR